MRFVYPVGAVFEPLNLQPGYLPLYISVYLIGASLDSAPTSFFSSPMRQGLLATSLASGAVALGILNYFLDKYTFKSILGGPNLASLV